MTGSKFEWQELRRRTAKTNARAKKEVTAKFLAADREFETLMCTARWKDVCVKVIEDNLRNFAKEIEEHCQLLSVPRVHHVQWPNLIVCD
jgi:hypothetical protein